MEKTILIIEDETALLYALESQLAMEGFRTLVASDGEEAVAMAFKQKPDLIVLDLILPKIDGWGVLKQLKSDSRTKSIPIVIISNLSDEDSRTRGLDLGAADYLAKINYSPSELVSKIKKIAK